MEIKDLAICETCRRYLKEYTIFEKIMSGFKEKYSSLGYAGGSVVLKNLSGENIEILEGFFQKNYHGKKSISISAKHFQKILDESRFQGVLLEDLLHQWFGHEFISKKEARKKEDQKRKAFFEAALEKCKSFSSRKWLKEVADSKKGTAQLLNRKYKENVKKAGELLDFGIKALEAIENQSNKREYLAVFSARITADPHYFDKGTEGGSLLSLLIEWYLRQTGQAEKENAVFPLLGRQKAYLKVGILLDDISNFAILSGVRVWKQDGSIHEGAEGFFKEKEVMQVPLAVAADWNYITCPENKIYIVENPSIFAILSARWKGRRACMCMYGQPKLTSVIMLDLLIKSNVQLFYAGDFDPEGLGIAQRLKDYCKENLHFWNMDMKAYEACISLKVISESRLKKLDKIKDEELQDLAREMRKRKAAGYQEQIWNWYL